MDDLPIWAPPPTLFCQFGAPPPPSRNWQNKAPAPGIEPATNRFMDRFTVGSTMLPLKWWMVCMGARG